MKSISKQERLEALDTLLNARRAHTQWVAHIAHITHQHTPCVIEDHTQCAFGKWLLKETQTLGTLPEFNALVEPHRQLHAAYTEMKGTTKPAVLRDTISSLSLVLIDTIDQLEKRLNAK